MNIWPRTIRSRLALGYAVAVALTVLVYAAVVYTFTESFLLEQLDARLLDDFERVEHAFEIAADGSLSWREVERPGHADFSAEAPWAEVHHPTEPAFIRWPAKPDPASGPYRTYQRGYEAAGEVYRLRLGRSLAPMRAKLNSLLWLLALCLLPVVGLAWLGGAVLARRALRPVDVMTERARRIGAAQLSERLPVGEAGDELDRLAAVFNAAFARLEASFERLRAFTSDAAHELRTPLAALRTVGEVALSVGADPGRDREALASMLEETQRLTRLVDQLLELSRGDARAKPLATEPIDLVDLVRSVCDQLDVLAGERDQTLRVRAEGVVTLPLERTSMRRAILNLVDNAIRHGPSGGRIEVQVLAQSGEVCIEVADEGPGIPEAHHDRLFDRFYRVDPSRAGSGTGLGLALAAQAVRAHGGRIELATPGQGGTCFRIILPSA